MLALVIVMMGGTVLVGPSSRNASASIVSNVSSDASGVLSVGGTLSWSLTPTAIPTMVSVSCAGFGTGITLAVTYGIATLGPAVTYQYSSLYVGMFFLANNPPVGTQTASVKLTAAGGSTDLECSATAWYGTYGIDLSIANTAYEWGNSQTYLSISPKSNVPSNEVFFSALSRYEWSTGTTLSVAGTGASASIVDSNTNTGTGSGKGCQAAGSSDVDCVASAQLLAGGTSMKYTWASYGAFAVAAGFGIGTLGGSRPSYYQFPGHYSQTPVMSYGTNCGGAPCGDNYIYAYSLNQNTATAYGSIESHATTFQAAAIWMQLGFWGQPWTLSQSGSYQITYWWKISWSVFLADVCAPPYGGSGVSGQLYVYGNLQVTDPLHGTGFILNKDSSTKVFDMTLPCPLVGWVASGVDQFFPVTFQTPYALAAGDTYVFYTYVWLQTAAEGYGFGAADGSVNAGSGGDYATAFEMSATPI